MGSARPGHWEGREEARLAGGFAVVPWPRLKPAAELADEAYSDLLPILKTMQAEKLSLRGMAEKLNETVHKTRRGKPWNPVQVSRVLERAG